MITKYNSFYFSKEDPDYSIKGSRDPLGFQVLWQHQGRKLIPYISTVSINLQDFQILCLAHYFYGKEADKKFASFFMRFEQLMAYVRINVSENTGFNGIDRVRKKINDKNKISVSNTKEDEILSNQRAYGIWGKYSRPFREIGFNKHKDFFEVFEDKVKSIKDISSIQKVIKKISDSEKAEFKLEDLKPLEELLLVTQNERSFYDDTILKVHTPTPFQNRLLEFIQTAALPKDFQLYSFLNNFSQSLDSNEQALLEIVTEIEFTERILSPANTIFRYLQTEPIWDKSKLNSDTYIDQCKTEINYTFHGDDGKIKNNLALTLRKSNWELVKDLEQLNKSTTEKRGGAPWLKVNNDILEVFHSEGNYKNEKFNPEVNYNNGYFINNYVHLYNQITTR
jgi:hypothetical protein